MKKMLSCMAAFLVSCTIMTAQNTTAAAPKNEPPTPMNKWTFFQIGFLPGVPGYTKVSNVYGLKLGAPLVDGEGRVCGLEPSFLYSGTSYVDGLQASWFGPAICREINGFQASIPVTIARTMYGSQASVTNIITDTGYGFDAGAVNIAKNFYGFQLSAVNVTTEEFRGFQFGVFNYSNKKGCQMGLVNIIKDGPLPFMLIFNGSF